MSLVPAPEGWDKGLGEQQHHNAQRHQYHTALITINIPEYLVLFLLYIVMLMKVVVMPRCLVSEYLVLVLALAPGPGGLG